MFSFKITRPPLSLSILNPNLKGQTPPPQVSLSLPLAQSSISL
jgi:hypothetical protein